MKARYLFLTIALFSGIREAAADLSPFGIVYGPKAAFNLTAPEGWVIDNASGVEQGLPCVLYRKGETWENADPLMYAKIASTSVEEYESFAKTAIEEMKKQRGGFKPKRIESGKTRDGHSYFVNEYPPNESYPRCERVAYVQLPKAVAFVVLSAENDVTLRKHKGALNALVRSITYLEVKKD